MSRVYDGTLVSNWYQNRGLLAVEKAQDPPQFPWSMMSWMRPGHFVRASNSRGMASSTCTLIDDICLTGLSGRVVPSFTATPSSSVIPQNMV